MFAWLNRSLWRCLWFFALFLNIPPANLECDVGTLRVCSSSYETWCLKWLWWEYPQLDQSKECVWQQVNLVLLSLSRNIDQVMRACCIGAKSITVLRLSHWTVGGLSKGCFSSERIDDIQVILATRWARLIYSTSVLNLEMTCCFFDCHNIRLQLR